MTWAALVQDADLHLLRASGHNMKITLYSIFESYSTLRAAFKVY